MIKQNKWKLIVSSIVILLPTLLGIVGKQFLPESIAVHWGVDGTADGWMSATLAFTLLPLILLAIHWLCLFLFCFLDKRSPRQNQKIITMSFWIIPTISILVCGIIFCTAIGYTAHIYSVILVILSLAFIIIGNYMPKTTRNLTTGIKIKWTLSSDENWNATHRFAGKIWVAAGVLCLCAIPLPSYTFPFVAIGLTLVGVLLPLLYSYRFYKKQLTTGELTKEDYRASYRKLVNPKLNKTLGILSAILVAVIAVVVCILMFTGSIRVIADDTALHIEASFYPDRSIRYEDIDRLEYHPEGIDGQRIYGFASARLLMGHFQNDTLGRYTRYTYTKSHACVLLTVNGQTVVIGTESDEMTEALYHKIREARIIDAE